MTAHGSDKGTSRSSRGQSRILEAVIAAVIIFLVFSVAAFLIRASDVKVLQERADLDRLGYNVLSGMIESEIIETVMENGSSSTVIELKTFVQRSLPLATCFNLTVSRFEASSQTGWVDQTLVLSLSNSESTAFIDTMEVSSTPTVYTSKSGNIYYVVLVLARAGEGS